MAAADPSDSVALAEARNALAEALGEKPICDRPAQTALCERALGFIDGALTGSVKKPAAAVKSAIKLLRAAADVGAPSVPPLSSKEPAPPLPSPPPPPLSREVARSERPVLAAAPIDDFSFEESPELERSQPVHAAPAPPQRGGVVLFDDPEPAPSAPPSPAPSMQAPLANQEDGAPEGGFDPELLKEFVGEADQYLQDAEGALLRLESSPEDQESIGVVFRCFHTIKGVSAFLGLKVVTELAHKAESLLSRMREGEIRCAGGYATLALLSVDTLKGLVRDVSFGQIPAETRALQALGEKLMNPEAHGVRADTVATPGIDHAEPDHGAPPVEKPQTADAKAQESSIRVRTDRLDRLIDMVGELVIAQSMISQDSRLVAGADHTLQRKIAHGAKIVRELQDLSMSLRMVPLRPTFQKVARVVRDVAQKGGRVVSFYTEGEDTEIDRNMVDVIADPLVHMARNAVDHGVEPPDERARAGKPPGGTVKLAAIRSGGEVVLQLSDDGRGIERSRVVKKAIERGLIASDAGMSDQEVLSLIFEPGFSTRDEVTDISGRGVGMDVVKRGVEALKGRIEIASTPGRGTTFSLRLPLTLAITDGMLVRVGSERYVLPSVNIRMSLRPDASALSTVSERGEFLRLRGSLVPIYRLHHIFDVPNAVEDPASALLVVITDGSGSAAILVDELLGQQQVVTKSLGGNWGQLPGIAGGAILGDGRVGLILDPAGIAQLARQRSAYVRPPAMSFDASSFDDMGASSGSFDDMGSSSFEAA